MQNIFHFAQVMQNISLVQANLKLEGNEILGHIASSLAKLMQSKYTPSDTPVQRRKKDNGLDAWSLTPVCSLMAAES